MPEHTPGVTLIVLCGGGARRMAGVDKPLQLLAGQPLAGHVIGRLAPKVTDVIISANRNLDRYRALHPPARVIPDNMPDGGPLAGLAAALDYVHTPLALTCPGDAPLADPHLLDLLLAALGEHDAAYPHDGQRAQHLFMLLRVALAPRLRDALTSGTRRVGNWVSHLDAISVDASTLAPSFANVNRFDELTALETRLRATTARGSEPG